MRLNRFLVSVCATGLYAACAQASAIPVNNPSFETLPAGGLNNGIYSVDAIPGWQNANFTGQFQPGSTSGNQYFNYLPAGPTIAYSNGNTIYQVVTPTVQLGGIYTLTVDIGGRKDTAFGGSADLLVGGVHYTATGVAPAPGDWSTYTATFLGTAANAGDAIQIDLNTSAVQGDFDNVSLTGPAPVTGVTPEPSSLVLFSTGALGFVAAVRRRVTRS